MLPVAPALRHGPGHQHLWERSRQATLAALEAAHNLGPPCRPYCTAAAAATFWKPEPPWGGEEGPAGRAALGAESPSPAIRPSPAGSVAQGLMQRRSDPGQTVHGSSVHNPQRNTGAFPSVWLPLLKGRHNQLRLKIHNLTKLERSKFRRFQTPYCFFSNRFPSSFSSASEHGQLPVLKIPSPILFFPSFKYLRLNNNSASSFYQLQGSNVVTWKLQIVSNRKTEVQSFVPY